MRKYINKIFGSVLLLLLVACSEELIVDEVIDNVSSGAVLRNLGEDNDLDIANLNSTYTILLEAQDASNGNLLSEVRVNVGYTDSMEVNIDTVTVTRFRVIPANEFNETSPTTNGLPVTRFTTTLQELLDHVGISSADMEVGDRFAIDFEMELIDGRVFNLDNATNDVTRTGFFSFFNAQFRYGAAIGDPQRVVLDEISIADDNELGILSLGDVDTVFLEFDREDAFVVNPTITQVSSVGAVDGDIGDLTQSEDDPEIYYFLYTAGASGADTISFEISGAETVAGFVMEAQTLKSAYIIDNTAPTGMVGPTQVSTDANRRISNVSIDLLFEPLGTDTVTFEIEAVAPFFDTQTLTRVISQDDEVVNLEFVPQVDGVAIGEGALEFNITTDVGVMQGAGIIDLIGNEASEVINVQLGN